MKNEILKLHKSKLIYFLLILIILFSLSMGFLFDSKSENISDFGYGVQEYETQEQLQTLISNQEDAIAELEQRYIQGLIEQSDYLKSLSSANTTLKVYNYLYENGLNYDEVQSTTGFTSFFRNKIRFMIFFITTFQAVIIVLSIIITLFIINYDFNSGVYKFIYSTGKGKSRSKLIIKKTLLCLLITISLSLIGIGLMLIVAIPFDIKTRLIILSDGNSVWTLTNIQYILSVIISHLTDIVFWSIIFSSLAMFIKNSYMLIISSVAFFIIYEGGLMSIPCEFTWGLTQMSIFEIDFGLSITQIVIIQIIKFIFAGLLYFGALYYFKNKDLA